MMWPSSQASKVLSAVFVGIILYCIFMDTFFFFRIQYYKIDTFAYNTTDESNWHNGTERAAKIATAFRPNCVDNNGQYEDVTWVSCDVNPLCHPTVKALMVDHVNHYIYGPLCALTDKLLGISTNMPFITPNMISFFHVFIAIGGAKLLTCSSLASRRIGVVIFQVRMFLDDLDGHVARERSHVKGERSEVGSVGYYVDGICDLFGVVAMMIGVCFYLRENRPRRGYKGMPLTNLPYHQLTEVNPIEDVELETSTEVGIMYKTKVSFKRIAHAILLFSGQMLLSSLAWNRYIDVYQDILERRSSDLELLARQERVFRSGAFFFATGLWRVLNPHSYLHLLSLAIFCDKTWSLLRCVQLGGYMCLVIAVAFTEYSTSSVYAFIGTR